MDVSFVNEQGESTVRTLVAKPSEDERPLLEDEGQRSTHFRSAVRILVALAGELIGTFLLILVICSAVSSAVLTGALVSIWEVALISGIGVAVSIYCVSHVSEACHLNPAITVASAVIRYKTFSWKLVLPYITVQMLGGILSGAVLFAFNFEAISLYERRNGIERGENSSVITAMMFGEYFPNPLIYDHSNPDNLKVTSMLGALFVEVWTTAIFAFVIFSLTDKSNTLARKSNGVLVPSIIGVTVSIMISTYGQFTQVGMNPARDLGPRLAAACAGWGTVAIPGPRGGFWVYVVGPVIGALMGAALSGLVLSKLTVLVKQWQRK
jgi:MIP family channel proteins